MTTISGPDVLGRKVKDKITGFEGIATGYVTYISGCNQVLVVPPARDGKAAESAWFDEQRLDFVGTTVVRLDNSRSRGPDRAAPIR